MHFFCVLKIELYFIHYTHFMFAMDKYVKEVITFLNCLLKVKIILIT